VDGGRQPAVEPPELDDEEPDDEEPDDEEELDDDEDSFVPVEADAFDAADPLLDALSAAVEALRLSVR
jgi:hypothetical protein